jgi:nitroimidazol reductase NimA-like FMN-containing flavoprotein (pyridoxamine 5'-phosphate oxidase superfamily)
MTDARLPRRSTTRPSPLPKPIREFIAAARVCRIATTRPNGEPHVIPVCPAFDGKDTLYVDIGPGYGTAMNIKNERRVAVLIDDYFEDWSRLRRVLLRCRAKQIRGAERDRAWRRIQRKFPQYKDIDWKPRLTLALHVYDWREEGVVKPTR